MKSVAYRSSTVTSSLRIYFLMSITMLVFLTLDLRSFWWMNQSQTNTGIQGTKGYVAPEWFRNAPVTIQVDVYSFGVLLLEIISCRKSVKGNESGNEYEAILTDWAWDCYQEGRLDLLVENDLEALDDYKKLKMFVMVGL